MRVVLAITIHWPNAGLILARRRRRRPNINPALGQCTVFAGNCPSNHAHPSHHVPDEIAWAIIKPGFPTIITNSITPTWAASNFKCFSIFNHLIFPPKQPPWWIRVFVILKICKSGANKGHRPNARLLLGHRPRCWLSIKTALDRCLVLSSCIFYHQ